MSRTKHLPDWLTILLFLIIVTFGWMNIFSATLGEFGTFHGFDMSEDYTKQAIWITLSIVVAVFILMVEAKFFRRFSSVIYVVSLLSLVGLFVFGDTVSGSTSWYTFGSFSIQPTEFVKAATALALAKYLSDISTDIRNLKHQLNAFLILFVPALLIIAQPDPGSALVYAAFIFPLYREGLSGGYLVFGGLVILLFVLTLLLGPMWMTLGIILAVASFLFLSKTKRYFTYYLGIGVLSILFAFSVDYIFYNVFQQHHRDRFNIVLGLESDLNGIGYNTHQSLIAIGGGGWTGEGWTKGTQTRGNFVPEQHTDYIFSTVGEEWGFLGSSLLIILFVVLISRIIFLAERQKSTFVRVYGYSVAGILFLHFTVNIGMVIGILPTVGIPLPFMSYGGSSLWGFTILLFIFLKLDADRKVVNRF